MSENVPQSNKCNADRTQRKTCVYYHEKTGRCARPADASTWQGRVASSGTAGKQ